MDIRVRSCTIKLFLKDTLGQYIFGVYYIIGIKICQKGFMNDKCHFIFFVFQRGTSGIDIDLRRVDIDQCPGNVGARGDLNIFLGTDKCKKKTTFVSITPLLSKDTIY